LDYLTTHTSLSPIRRGFTPGFVNYKKGCSRLAAASDKVYQLLAYGRWFFPVTPASSTTKTGHYDIAEILLKVALNTINQSINQSYFRLEIYIIKCLFTPLPLIVMTRQLLGFSRILPTELVPSKWEKIPYTVKHVLIDFTREH